MAFGINDTLNFCIMTTANYITKALVMYDSLVKECNSEINFFYFTFDESTYNYLKELNYKNITPVPLHDLEAFYPELKGTISTRSKAEYFFTCTPHIIDYVLKNYEVDHVTYLDADLYFYQDPRRILNELQNNSVLITEHRHYPEQIDHPNGKYCVQFIPFKNDKTGNQVVTWWKEKCIEWCYYRAEDGKFADQGYLNNWPELFDDIVIMENRGGGVARWNTDAYTFYKEENRIKAFNKEINDDVDIIFYHFEGLKIYSNNFMFVGPLKTDLNIFEFIYQDYISKLSEKEKELIQKIGISRKQFDYPPYDRNWLKFWLGEIRRVILPKKGDRTFFYKYKNTYKWLP